MLRKNNGNRSIIFLILLSIWLYGAGLFQLPVTDRDEALFAQASKQMVQSGDYGQIKVQNKNRHLKPPGIYWLQAGLTKVFDVQHRYDIGFFRLASALGATLSVILLFLGLKPFMREKQAFYASALLGTSLLLQVEGHIATTDAVLLCTIVIMQMGLLQIYLKNSRWLGPFCFWLGLALGVAIKGISPIFGFLTLVTLMIVDRNPRLFLKIKPLYGIIFFILISLAWLIPISVMSHSNFLLDMIKGDLLPKLKGGQQGHGHAFGYFLVISPLLLWPGSILLGKGIFAAMSQRKEKLTRFMLAWLIPSWILFEIVPTKLPEYVLPCFPAIMVLLVLAVQQPLRGVYHIIEVLIRLTWLAFSLTLLVALMATPQILHQKLTLGQLLTIFILALTIIYVILRYHKLALLKVLIIYSLVFYPLLMMVYLPSLHNFWLSRKIVDLVTQQKASPYPLLSADYREPSLIFRLGTNKVLFMKNNQQIKQQLKTNQYALLSSTKTTGFNVFGCVSGFEYNGGHWQSLCLVTAIYKS